MAIEITTYQVPEAGQDMKVYLDALLDLKDQATDFSRSLGRVSWLQGHILLLARAKCTERGDWRAFLASVGMKKETAYLLRRVATDIVPESKDMEYNEMLAIVFPNSYGKHLRDESEAETFAKQGMVIRKSTRKTAKTQTVDKVYARLASVKNSIQQVADRPFLDSKLNPAQAIVKINQALGVIDVCNEELGKLRKKLEARKSALTVEPKPVSKETGVTTPETSTLTVEPVSASEDRRAAA